MTDVCVIETAGEFHHSQMSGGGISIPIQRQNVFPSCIVSQWSLLYVSSTTHKWVVEGFRFEFKVKTFSLRV